MKDWNTHKKNIIKELAKLENMDWAENDEIADSIFPYVLIEAINILKNSEIIKNPKDLTNTGEKVSVLIEKLTKD